MPAARRTAASALPEIKVHRTGEYVSVGEFANETLYFGGTHTDLSNARIYRTAENELVIQLECGDTIDCQGDAMEATIKAARRLEITPLSELPDR